MNLLILSRHVTFYPPPPMRPALLLLMATTLLVTGCTSRAGGDVQPQDVFWSRIHDLCGMAFSGRMTHGNASDSAFASVPMVMHIRACDDNQIDIPFHVGDDRSRTWVLTRTDDGLRLKHDHRHEDGSEDEITQYGGDTKDEGTATAQQFHADAFTAELLPAASSNVWTMEIHPDSLFAYALRREAEDRHFRAEFDLTRPVAVPLSPWGHPDLD